MPAIIHPGAVVHCWDHLVISLRDGRAGPATGFLSLYAITYSPSLGAGHVAVVEVPGRSTPGLAATFSDDPAVGQRQQERLRAMGEDREALRDPPLLASFENCSRTAGPLPLA